MNKVDVTRDDIKWRDMHPVDRERLLLQATEGGFDIDDIAKKLGVKEDTLTRFMRSRGYAYDSGEFITIQEKEVKDILPVLANMSPEARLAVTGEEGMQKLSDIVANYDIFRVLVDNQDKLMALLSGEAVPTNNGSNTVQNEAVDILSPTLELPTLAGDLKRITIRINEDLFDRINDLWKTKYKGYKQHDLINKRLYDFYEKYR